MKKRMIILLAILAFLGCATEQNNKPEVVLNEVKIGEAVYVCGCPMMCCNSISRSPGRCSCNVPLKLGTVSRIRDGRVYVAVSGREKAFLLTKK
ncbi:MAG: hypothetical protein CVU71_17135 [Deltaproteobacteria bacterium HGW-Deltaproteobacteria-6]|jgi:hypothetical protein|nr:MAG: hypothetical protein CVU71_17135 [Deltaproteobacteria bacterium HGW-Deltaproteobacteria-6]